MILPAAFKPLILVWLAWLAYRDFRTRVIPWYLTWPVTAALCLVYAVQGAWAPLALFLVYLVWDTSYSDLQHLRGKRFVKLGDRERWLLPAPVALGLTVLLLVMARAQGQAAFVLTFSFAVIHAAWRWGKLPGGDAALLIVLIALFPSMAFITLATGVAGLVALVQLYLRNREDLVRAGQMLFFSGPLAAWDFLYHAWRAKARPQPAAWLLAVAGALAVFIFNRAAYLYFRMTRRRHDASEKEQG